MYWKGEKMKFYNYIKEFLYKKNFDLKDCMYYNIIFWPLIFTLSELVGFPSVLLILISLIFMLGYLKKYDKKRFKFALTYFIIIPLAVQLIIVCFKNLNFNFDLDRIETLIKFNIRWMHLIVILYLFSDRKLIKEIYNYARNAVNKIFIAASIFLVIEITFLFLNSGYENIWDGSYFKGPFFNPHVNSYFLMVPMISFGFCYFKFQDKKYKYLSLFFSTITVGLNLLTGARTSSVIALGLYFILFFAGILKNKKLLIGVPLAATVLLIFNFTFNIIDLTSIPLVKKTIMVLNNPYGFLNGRNYIWTGILTYQYKNFTLLNYLFGMGLGESMQVNYIMIRKYLWAHNDLIETFNGLGLYGISAYLYVCYKYFYKNKYFITAVMLCLLLFFNGLLIYSELGNFIPFISMVYAYQRGVFSLDDLEAEEETR